MSGLHSQGSKHSLISRKLIYLAKQQLLPQLQPDTVCQLVKQLRLHSVLGRTCSHAELRAKRLHGVPLDT